MLSLGLAGCSQAPPRGQSLYLRIEHAAIVPDGPDSGHILLRLRSVRHITPLSTLVLELQRPDGSVWRSQRTVTAGSQRFEWLSPRINGFVPDQAYTARITLLGPDRISRLDTLRQRLYWPAD